jgi:hypothetical protein
LPLDDHEPTASIVALFGLKGRDQRHLLVGCLLGDVVVWEVDEEFVVIIFVGEVGDGHLQLRLKPRRPSHCLEDDIFLLRRVLLGDVRDRLLAVERLPRGISCRLLVVGKRSRASAVPATDKEARFVNCTCMKTKNIF